MTNPQSNVLHEAAIIILAEELKRSQEETLEILEAKVSAVDEASRSFTEKLLSEAISAVREEMTFELPQEVVFDAHLQETASDIRYEFSRAIKGLDTEIKKALDEDANALIELTNQYNIHNHDRDYAPLEEFHLTTDALQTAIKSNKEEAETRLNQRIVDLDGRLTNKIETVDFELRKIVDETAQRAGRELLRLEQRLAEEHSDRIRDQKTAKEQVFESLKVLSDVIKANAKDARERHNKLKNYVDAQIDTRSHVSHGHADLSPKTHLHDDRYSQLDHDHDRVYSKLGHNHNLAYAPRIHAHEQYITKVEAEESKALLLQQIKLKQDRAEFVRALEALPNTNEIAQAVLKMIDLPKDGKDAHEWEFKWHPTQRGTLLMKREDQKQWQAKNLLVQVPAQEPPVNLVSSGGGGFIKHGGIVHVWTPDGRVEEVHTYAGETLTDANGEFSFSYSEVNYGEILSCSVSSLAHPDDNLPVEERWTDAKILTQSTSSTTGIVYRQREDTNLLGDLTYNMIPAGANIPVKILIYGLQNG